MEANLKEKQDKAPTREDRVAAALRENLLKRKQQLQTRETKIIKSKDNQ